MFEQVLTSFDIFGQVWTSLDKFELPCVRYYVEQAVRSLRSWCHIQWVHIFDEFLTWNGSQDKYLYLMQKEQLSQTTHLAMTLLAKLRWIFHLPTAGAYISKFSNASLVLLTRNWPPARGGRPSAGRSIAIWCRIKDPRPDLESVWADLLNKLLGQKIY